MQKAIGTGAATHLRLLVRILQDVVRAEAFESYADLKEAFKCRCARLGVPYDGGLIAEALDQLERGGRTPLIGTPFSVQKSPRGAEWEKVGAPREITRADAVRILALIERQLGIRLVSH